MESHEVDYKWNRTSRNVMLSPPSPAVVFGSTEIHLLNTSEAISPSLIPGNKGNIVNLW